MDALGAIFRVVFANCIQTRSGRDKCFYPTSDLRDRGTGRLEGREIWNILFCNEIGFKMLACEINNL